MLLTRTTETDPKAVVLRDLLGFTGERDRDLAALAMHFDEIHVEAGEPLIHEGEPGRELFVIVEGRAAVSVHDQPLATVGPGEIVGEMSLFEFAPRSATVIGLTPMRALVAGAQSFATLLNEPAVLRRLAAILARRLRASQGSPAAY